MTDATRTIIRAAFAADNAVSDYERAQIEGALRGRVSALPDPDVRHDMAGRMIGRMRERQGW